MAKTNPNLVTCSPKARPVEPVHAGSLYGKGPGCGRLIGLTKHGYLKFHKVDPFAPKV